MMAVARARAAQVGEEPSSRAVALTRLRRISRSKGGLVTFGVVIGLLAALGITLFGLGTVDHALATSNASAWLFSSTKGEVARVNGETGKVDTRFKVVDAQGHVIQVSQSDRYLLLRDLTTGKVSSLDLATLQISATTQTTAGLGVTLALSGEAAFIIDAVQGVVRQLDPIALTPVGEPLRFPPGVLGGLFDGAGTLWIQPRSLTPPSGTPSSVAWATWRTRRVGWASPTWTRHPSSPSGPPLQSETSETGASATSKPSWSSTVTRGGSSRSLGLDAARRKRSSDAASVEQPSAEATVETSSETALCGSARSSFSPVRASAA